MEEKLAHAVVGHENVGESVAIVIGERDAERAALERGDAGTLADVFECAVAAIAVKNIGGLREFGGRAVRLPLVAADLAVLGVPQHVAGDEQVEMAVVVVVEEPCGTAPASGFATPALAVTSVKVPSPLL